VSRRLSLLNTNSRFNYEVVADFCARLAALAPRGLDAVLLVNSGSEATDLAMRIARAVTGRETVLALTEAYHGVTFLSDAVTTEHPGSERSRPAFVHLLEAPNALRGRLRGRDADSDAGGGDASAGGGYAARVREEVAALVAAGRPPAALICEPLLGNAGGLELPRGYLREAWAAVRAAGGLAVCDEVQVGLGRTGATFWAHEFEVAEAGAAGLAPDVLTVAKALGNGFPLGAVLTSHAVAAAFRERCGGYFSSSGGSPASCAAGLAVLDTIEREGLQANALRVGAHLKARLLRLAAEGAAAGDGGDGEEDAGEDARRPAPLFPFIAAVHGRGLYLGVELVRGRDSLEPAAHEAEAVCERLRERGVLCQTASVRGNVLKLKPPLTMTLGEADFFAEQLEVVLRTGF
jgi:4-aminobutyrate aminotransferase-like enzyme